MLGIFLTSALFFLLLYFSINRRISLIWLSLYCFSHPIKSIFKPWQDIISSELIVPFQEHYISQAIVVVGGFFLLAFLIYELELNKKIEWLLGAGIFCLMGYFFFSDELYSDILSLISLALATFGVIRKRDSAIILLIGIIGYIAFIQLGRSNILGLGYFTGIIFFIVCMLVYMNRKISLGTRLQHESNMRAKTLENQLLKTSIQPHFVINSLATLQELIDRSPKKASDFVEKLAGEFRLINQGSAHRLIPIEEEIALCRYHLKIMEYRRDAKFSLEIHGINGTEQVPPGIFHTLLENGITHGYQHKNTGIFKLEKTIVGDSINYIFFNDSEYTSQQRIKEGTGLKYIRARLEETYGEAYELNYHSDLSGWTVHISLKT